MQTSQEAKRAVISLVFQTGLHFVTLAEILIWITLAF
jgi:hypothetical protein